MSAGKYKEPFTWLVRSANINNAGADEEDTFADTGTLWGSLAVNSGTREEYLGSLQGQQQAIIVLRQWVDVSVRDRLTHQRTSLTWKVTGVRQDYAANETVIDAVLYEENVLGDN